MKSRVFRCIALLIIMVVFSVSFSFKVNGYDIYTYYSYKSLNNVELLQNDSQAYLIGTNNKDVQIDAVYPDNFSVSLNLEHNVYAYNLFGNSLVLVCPVAQLSQTQFVIYDIDTDIITSFYINKTLYCESSQLAYSGNYVYIADDYGNVFLYSKNGKLLTTFEVHSDRCNLMCDYYGTVYCITNNSLYEVSGQNIYHICNCNIDAPARFISSNTFVDAVGCVYTLGSNGIFSPLGFQSTATYPSGGICNNCVITAKYNTINAVDINSNIIERYANLNKQIESICVVDNNILALVHQSGYPAVCHITYSQLSKYNHDNSNEDTPDISADISSEIYEIDHQNQWIVDIPAGTTVAKFKRNVNYNGFNVSFVRNDKKIIESGNIGTGTIVTFYNDEVSIEYALSVKGDLTGEGNMNSRDKTMLFNYLLEENSPTGVYFEACDLDYSNSIDAVDLVILKTEFDDIDL